MKRRILVVDDERSMTQMLKILFEKEGYSVELAASAEEAIPLISSKAFDLVISDIRMGHLSGIELLREIKKENDPPETILMTAYASTDTAIEALKLGAADYIVKPFDVEEMLHRAKSAIDKRGLREENTQLKAEFTKAEGFSELLGRNDLMQKVYSLIQRTAPTNSSVLIQGESGTGKELAAKAIHASSLRKNKPFISINCGGIPETLLESELFGYAKGAFTGAYASKKGLFDVADGGSLFLDEIGEMSPLMQIKLLRALQEKKIRPVGSTEEHFVDVRLITATNRDLPSLVKEGSFREDLFYRINVIRIEMPPLRARKDDIAVMVRHFLEKYSAVLKKPVPAIPKETIDALESYDWPGNVRELENVIERALALDQRGVLTPDLLPETVTSSLPDRIAAFLLDERNLADRVLTSAAGGCGEQPQAGGPECSPDTAEPAHPVREGTTALGHGYVPALPPEGFSLEKTVEDFEISLVRRALELEGGNMTRAAKRLGISYRSMRHLVNGKYRGRITGGQ